MSKHTIQDEQRGAAYAAARNQRAQDESDRYWAWKEQFEAAELDYCPEKCDMYHELLNAADYIICPTCGTAI